MCVSLCVAMSVLLHVHCMCVYTCTCTCSYIHVCITFGFTGVVLEGHYSWRIGPFLVNQFPGRYMYSIYMHCTICACHLSIVGTVDRMHKLLYAV